MSDAIYNLLDTIYKSHAKQTNNPNPTGSSFIKSILEATSNIVDNFATPNDYMAKQIKAHINMANSFIDQLPTITDEQYASMSCDVQKAKDDFELSINKFATYLKFSTDCIEGLYDQNIDILKIHDYIITQLNSNNKAKVDILTKHIQELRETHHLTRTQRLFNEMKIKEFEEEVNNLINDKNINNYRLAVEKVITDFKNIGPIYSQINLESNVGQQTHQHAYRLDVISDYIRIAGQYFDLILNRLPENTNICYRCNYDLREVNLDEQEFCPGCNVELLKIDNVNSISNAHIIHNSSKSNYEHELNFTKFLNRILCIHNSEINSETFNDITQYVDNYIKDDELTCLDICSMEPNLFGRRGPYKLKIIFNALAALKLTNLEPDINYIAHVIWNWAYPKADHLIKNIMADRAIVEDNHIKIKKKYNQNSNINNWHLAYRLLEKNGYQPCNIEDFKSFKTIKTLNKYEKMYAEICTMAGWSVPKPINTVIFD